MPESVGRKQGIARTGADQTRLSEPDLRAASFVREGVVDKSGLFEGEAAARQAEAISGAIEDFGQVGLDIDEGIAKAKLEEDLQQEIDFAMESREPDANILRDEVGEGAAIAFLDPEFFKNTGKLSRAKTTGAISVEEFELRTTEALRRAVNRRPGLINELTQHAQNILGLENTVNKLKLDDRLIAMEAQAEAERDDRVNKQLDNAKLPYNIEDPTEKKEELLNRHRRQELAYEQGKRLREMNQAISQEEGLSFLRQGGSDFAAGAYNAASEAMREIFTGDSKLLDAKLRANNIVKEFKDDFDAIGRKLFITNTPEFKDLKENWVGAIENLASTLEDAKSGDDAARIARNHMAVIQNQHERKVYDLGVNPVLARVAGHMEKFIEGSSLLKRKGGIQDQMTAAYEALLTGAVGGGTTDKLLRSSVNGNDSDLSLILDSTVKSALPEDKPGHPEDFEKMVESAMTTIENNIGKNQTLAFKTMTDTIRKLANPDVRKHLDRATPDTKAELVNMAITQASALEPDRNRFLKNARDEGVNIRNRVLPNGTLQFYTEGDTAKDRKFLKQFNSKFAKKYNDLIRFKSVLFGMSVPQASDMLADIYSGGSVQEIREVIDSRRKELNVPEVDDAFIERLVDVESSGNPEAKASTSNAVGAAQFIPSTWLDVTKKHASNLVAGKSEEEILEMRKNPTFSRSMAKAYSQDNVKKLEGNGIETSNVNLYLAHFLGPNGAVNLLSSSPDTPVDDVLGKRAIRANKSVLEGKTVGEVIQWAQRKFQ